MRARRRAHVAVLVGYGRISLGGVLEPAHAASRAKLYNKLGLPCSDGRHDAPHISARFRQPDARGPNCPLSAQRAPPFVGALARHLRFDAACASWSLPLPRSPAGVLADAACAGSLSVAACRTQRRQV